jgi:hypothetical protein
MNQKKIGQRIIELKLLNNNKIVNKKIGIQMKIHKLLQKEL